MKLDELLTAKNLGNVRVVSITSVQNLPNLKVITKCVMRFCKICCSLKHTRSVKACLFLSFCVIHHESGALSDTDIIHKFTLSLLKKRKM